MIQRTIQSGKARKMKVGIVGTGYISSMHMSGYNARDAEIVAVTDISKDNYLQRKEIYGDAKFYDTYDELIADPAVEAVDVCVINRFHIEMVKKAVAAGKHIFCEKTMTDSQAGSAELLELLADYDKNFQIGYMKRFFPATQKAVELLPEIGEVFSAYIRSYQGGWVEDDVYDSPYWKPKDGKESHIRSFSSGGMLNMGGSHMLDLMNLFLGEPESVYSLNWGPRDYDVEMTSNSLFAMKSGARVHFEAAASPYAGVGIHKDGWDEVVELNGRKGRLEIHYTVWNRPMENAPLVRLYREKDKAFTDFTFQTINAFQEEICAFVDNCTAGKKSVPAAAEGYYVDKIIEACYKSAESNEVVRFC